MKIRNDCGIWVSRLLLATAVTFEMQKYTFSGHMVAVMALMEAPAIIIGVILIEMYNKKEASSTKIMM
jgi:hypothetical protein